MRYSCSVPGADTIGGKFSVTRHAPASASSSLNQIEKAYGQNQSQDLTKAGDALTRQGRFGAVDRIGAHLQAMMESLKTWAELGISADVLREQ